MVSYGIRSSDDSLTWNKKSIQEFNDQHCTEEGHFCFNMLNFIQNIYASLEGTDITNDTDINDQSEEFFSKFNSWLHNKHESTQIDEFYRQLRNLLVFRSLSSMIQSLPDKYLIAEEVLLEARMGTTSRP